jgi:hypothetical protein
MLNEAIRSAFLSRLKIVATSRRGLCLSDVYISSHSKMKWRCLDGHEWLASPNNIFRGKWCPTCARIALTTINRQSLVNVRALGRSRGGGLVSTSYSNNKMPLKWLCLKGHEFSMTASGVSSGHWCALCTCERRSSIREIASAEKEKSNLKKALALAIRAGVQLDNAPSPGVVIGRCSHGHKSKVRIENILADGWTCKGCQRDAKAALLFRRAKEFAAKRNGLVEMLPDSQSRRFRWSCALKHVWVANIDNIASGTWCPKCADKTRGAARRSPLLSLEAIAKSRGGFCRGVNYDNGKAIGHWRCSNKHEWSASVSSVKSGSWCARCAGGISERICRIYFECLFGVPFPRVRPDWLRNETGVRLELDGYSESLQIAFEHQGHQHYSQSAHLKGDFQGILARDFLKAKICKERGLRLITIPELASQTKIEELRSVIRDKCLAEGVILPLGFETIQVNLISAFAKEDSQLLCKISSRNGRLIGPIVTKRGLQLKLMCERGHTFYALAVKIKRGQWCPSCSGKRLSIADMRVLAQGFNGKCLSTRYFASKAKLRWECSKGHKFLLPHSHVKQGRWCQICALERRVSARRGNLKPIAEAVRVKGGSILTLDAEYGNRRQQIEVVCAKGHRWFARGADLLKGKWCAQCARIRKLSVEILQQFALQKGGKCLAVDYHNAHQKVEWECSKRHRWIAEITNILHNGRWCPICARPDPSDKGFQSIRVSSAKKLPAAGVLQSSDLRTLRR